MVANKSNQDWTHDHATNAGLYFVLTRLEQGPIIRRKHGELNLNLKYITTENR